MIQVTLTGPLPEIEIVKTQMEKDYIVVNCKKDIKAKTIHLTLELPTVKKLERGIYELEIPSEYRASFNKFIQELNNEEIRFQLEEEDRRLLLSFQLLDRKRVAELYKAYCINCGIDHNILQRCSIFVDGHMKEPFEKAMDGKGIEYTFTPKGTGYILELSKMDIPAFERIRKEFDEMIRNRPLELTNGKIIKSHRQRGGRTR